jgi:hypothetical protein
VNQLDKTKLILLGYQCLNCKKKKNIPIRDFVTIVYSSAAVGDWIMKPELSTTHLGIQDRDLEYEEKVQLQPYCLLGLVKRGKSRVTRKHKYLHDGLIKEPEAVSIVEVPNRYLAGITEVALKNYYADKKLAKNAD